MNKYRCNVGQQHQYCCIWFTLFHISVFSYFQIKCQRRHVFLTQNFLLPASFPARDYPDAHHPYGLPLRTDIRRSRVVLLPVVLGHCSPCLLASDSSIKESKDLGVLIAAGSSQQRMWLFGSQDLQPSISIRPGEASRRRDDGHRRYYTRSYSRPALRVPCPPYRLRSRARFYPTKFLLRQLLPDLPNPLARRNQQQARHLPPEQHLRLPKQQRVRQSLGQHRCNSHGPHPVLVLQNLRREEKVAEQNRAASLQAESHKGLSRMKRVEEERKGEHGRRRGRGIRLCRSVEEW